jgi:hypothetical protein
MILGLVAAQTDCRAVERGALVVLRNKPAEVESMLAGLPADGGGCEAKEVCFV